jgi:hypothetical protein
MELGMPLKKKGLEEGPVVGESKADFAKRLGMGIIRKSKILRKWF